MKRKSINVKFKLKDVDREKINIILSKGKELVRVINRARILISCPGISIFHNKEMKPPMTWRQAKSGRLEHLLLGRKR